MKKQKINPYLFWSAIFFGVLLIIFLIANSQPKPVLYDAENYHPYGLKALNLFFEKIGLRVNQPQPLEKTPAQILIVPTTNDFSVQSRQKLMQWVKAGGVVLELAEDLPQLNLKSTKTLKYLKLQQKTYCLKINDQKLVYTPKGKNLFGNPYTHNTFLIDQAAFVYASYYGKGTILSWNDPQGLTNIHLKKHPENAVILALILKQITKHQQISFYSIVDQIKPVRTFNTKFLWNQIWQGVTLCLLLFSLIAWKLSIRFGRPRPLDLIPGRSAEEFITSLASLWQRAGIYPLVLENLWQALFNKAAELTSLPSNTDPSLLFAKVHALTGQDLRVLIRAWESKEIINTRANFLETARILDFYRREFTLWKKSKHF